MNKWFGFTKIYVDDDAYPVDYETQWIGDAFVIFGYCIWIGKIKHASEQSE